MQHIIDIVKAPNVVPQGSSSTEEHILEVRIIMNHSHRVVLVFC